MLSDPDGVLDRATGPRHERRFYPPEGNPVTHRLRAQLFALERIREELDEAGQDLSQADESIAHVRAEIRRVEIGCDVDKCRYLLAHYERLERETAWTAERIGSSGG